MIILLIFEDLFVCFKKTFSKFYSFKKMEIHFFAIVKSQVYLLVGQKVKNQS